MTAPVLLTPATVAAHVETCLTAIAANDEKLRAMITVLADDARAQAMQQDEAAYAGRHAGRLAGVTITLKDVIHTAGIRTTNGSDIDRDFVPDEDAEIVRRLKSAGAIILGKANLHEYAYGGTTQNPFYGSCRNPWDLSRIPGGSSGGSAVAVAAGMCLVSLGTDTAGSGRLPAALCGVSGLRPTSGAIPNRGVTTVSAFFDTISPMARRVSDIRSVFEIIAGPDPEDPFCGQPFNPPATYFPQNRLDGLRIGIPENYFLENIDPDVELAFQKGVTELEQLGAILVPVALPDAEQAPAHFEKLFHSDCAFEHARTMTNNANRLGADTNERLRTLGGAFTAVEYAAAMSFMRRWQWQVRRIFSTVDLIAHPTVPVVAPTLAEVTGTTAATRRLTVNLYPWSLAQVPVLTLPCGFAEHDMPCGMSLVAPWWHEDRLFSAGNAYQQVTDWHLREPEIVSERKAGPAL
jgi:aspartyl-tRNA(Asn)/glutamyl-tRNA(Gln) amidotransferase subunit A